MNFKISQGTDGKTIIAVSVDAQDLLRARNEAAAALAQTVKVPGFRTGKVPAEVAEQYIDINILASRTLDIAVRSSLTKIIRDEKLQVMTTPEVDVKKIVTDELVEYEATLELAPEVKLADYTKIVAPRPALTVQDSEIEDVLARVAKARTKTQVVKRPAQNGDSVIIDFTGYIDEQAFAGGSAKDYKLELGSGAFIAGFEEGIIGHSSGDRFDLQLTFPVDYGNAEYAGKAARFNVLVKQVNESTVPTYDDTFAAECGPFANMAEFRADIRANLDLQNQLRADNYFKDALVAQLIEDSEVPAPEILVTEQMLKFEEEVARTANAQNLTLKQYLELSDLDEAAWEEQKRQIATQRVQSLLVIQKIANLEQIGVERELVESKIRELRQAYKKSKEMREALKNPNVWADIENRLIVEKTLDFLVNKNLEHAQAFDPTAETQSKAVKSAKSKTAKSDKESKDSQDNQSDQAVAETKTSQAKKTSTAKKSVTKAK